VADILASTVAYRAAFNKHNGTFRRVRHDGAQQTRALDSRRCGGATRVTSRGIALLCSWQTAEKWALFAARLSIIGGALASG